MLRLMFRSGDHWSPLNVPPLSRLRHQLPSMGANKPLLEERCHAVTEWWLFYFLATIQKRRPVVAPTISIIFLKRKYLHKHKRHRHADNGGDCVSDDAWTVNEIIKQPNDNCLYYEVRNIRYKEFYKLNKSQTFFKCKLTVQQIRHHI